MKKRGEGGDARHGEEKEMEKEVVTSFR